MKHRLLYLALVAVCSYSMSCILVRADGLQDNIPEKVRAVPPVGVQLTEQERKGLEAGLKNLRQLVKQLRQRSDQRTVDLLPDVEIFLRAVDHGVQYRELFSVRDVKNASKILAEGQNRAEALLKGEAPWTTQKGLVVRGFRSRIDRTVQPYGLVIPDSYTDVGHTRYRLDLWFHGRGERSSESVFIAERMIRPGRFTPQDTIVLHPYGRYSNAFKFAGEVDVLEALEHASQHYKIDDDRIAVRGFSMGGAGCWQMAVHYSDLFFAANPGAGFSETPEFLRSFQKETLTPTDFERKLWRMYDCPGYADNLYQLPTVAYSGELDIQKQAADIMETALAQRNLKLTHIIGPETKHTIDPASIKIIEEKMDHLAEVGRAKLPTELHFATFTLKYNRLHWLTVTGMDQHWEPSTVRAKLIPQNNAIEINANNVTSLRLSIPAGRSSFRPDQPVSIAFSSSKQTPIIASQPETDGSWQCDLYRESGVWRLGQPQVKGLQKVHNLQGPIDDAFMDSFIVVRPTGQARQELVGRWTQSELKHLVVEWRRHFRGDAVVKDDTEITQDDLKNNHLILFGDPQSNAVMKSVIEKLPIEWTDEHVRMGDQKFSAADHVPAMIYPNPANPSRYVVLNSGFTYREYAYLNNARQVPKLPDWAIIDLKTPADSLWPGKVVAADFFDEKWQVKH
ncbi:prolyl oligopeptidase family serine peptidase [Rhodopirellula sp.]|nr:prolyl oligopeptidase family serine peptidase [Rubripirellula sp.]MDA7874048.1 prolyl oligopeptidase family serine peptidase [Rhodopirellula sp.]MDA7914655.1 prolyl oligopeptidase family serine peptidase [bacterium]MDB4621684.1 prolyl oligopeptidase family serine peptidase [Rubripirellula sp.]